MTRTAPVRSTPLRGMTYAGTRIALFTRALAVGCIVTGLLTRLPAQELSLRVEVVGITETAVNYVLTNQSPKPATAWTVGFTTHDSAGQQRRSGTASDAVNTIALQQLDPSEKSHVIAPGASRQETSPIGTSPGATVVKVDARTVAVVFEDGSSVGDATAIDDIFAARQARRDTFAAFLSEVRAALASGGRPSDLDELTVKTKARQESYPSPIVAGGLLQNLSLAQVTVSRGTIDSISALQNLANQLAIQHATAAKHAVRAN
jgi:hypothetical protein